MNRNAAKNKAAQRNIPKGASRWLLFFVACGCMFVIGVLVGRNTMPVRFDIADLNEKLGRLQKSVLTEDAAGGEKVTSPEDSTIEFYEALRDDRLYGFSADEEMPLRLIKPKFEKDPPSSTTLAAVDSQALQPQSPGKTEKETTRNPYEQEMSLRQGYVIQVASVRDLQNAKTVRDKFRDRGYPAYTQQAVVAGKGQWCRVRIGPYTDRKQARRDLERLQQAGVDAILLMTDNNK